MKRLCLFVIIVMAVGFSSLLNAQECISGNCENGEGTMTYPKGGKYVGHWKDGKMDGQGTMTWPDGRKYVGQWKDGKKDGQGTLYKADGSISKKGQWKKDEYIGE